MPTAQLFDPICSEISGQRVDNFLVCHLKGVPKSRIYRAVRMGEVRINQKRVPPGYRLQIGDQLSLPPLRFAQSCRPERAPAAFLQLLKSSILFEDSAIMVINKPAGVASHGGSGVHFGVIEGLRLLRPGLRFLALGHRLDKQTTGCMLLAKKRESLKALHHAFLSGKVRKHYLALLSGRWKAGNICVRQPLIKNRLLSGERIVAVHQDGKLAETFFQPLQIFRHVSLMKLKPLTGRMHQIRVHSAYLGYPVVGDTKYGFKGKGARIVGTKRLLLHAATLEFSLLGRSYEFCATLDTEFQRMLKRFSEE